MASLNKIILIGRLTADPELRYTPSSAPVCNFTIAVDRKFSKSDETDFISIVAWHRLAEICNEFLTKGKLVAIEGELQTRTYEDRDGQKRKAFDVVASEMQMLDRGGNREGGQSSKPAQSQQRSQGERAANEGYGYPPADDNLGIDDIPF